MIFTIFRMRGIILNTDQLKYLTAITLIIVGVMALTGCSSKPQAQTEANFEGEDVLVFEVFGMDCPGCHGGLEKLMATIPGVIDSKASWEEKTVKVIVSEDEVVNNDDIRNAIERANFTPGERLK